MYSQACLQNPILSKSNFYSLHAPRVGKFHDFVPILSSYGIESVSDIKTDIKRL